MTRRDGIGLVAVALALGTLALFRALYVEPREWGGLCAGPASPLACYPRGALLWLQHFSLWGAAALALGLGAFIGAPFWIDVAAVALGAMAVANYNATWGMLGAALGAWAWIRRP